MNHQATKKPFRRKIWKHIYINLVEIDVFLSYFAVYFLGAKDYWLMVLFIGISLGLGYSTSYIFWHLIETSHGKRVDDELE